MAKFYERFFPPLPDQVVLYGYRGDTYIINGQSYDNNTNLERVGVYQCQGTVSSRFVAPVTVPTVFEPTHIGGSNYDINGSRYDGDYNAAIHTLSSCTVVDNNKYSSKNVSAGWTSCFTTCTNSSIYEGQPVTSVNYAGSCMSGAGVCFIGSYFQTCSVGCSFFCDSSCIYNIIEEPAGVFNCFQNFSFPIRSFCACTSSGSGGTVCWTSQNNCEFIYGCTGSVTYLPAELGASACCSYCWAVNGPTNCGFQDRYFVCNLLAPTTSSNEVSDGHLLGSITHCSGYILNSSGTVGGATNQTSYKVFGSGPVRGNSLQAGETGFRTFVTASGTSSTGFLYYMFYNSNGARGPLQGSDTSTALTAGFNRLQLKVLNKATNSVTSLATFKKVGGALIPSQPDLDDSNSYRFYMINFDGVDVGTLSAARYTIAKQAGTLTVNNYTMSMSNADQLQVYTNLGFANTGNGKVNNASFRRQSVNRIWYSTALDGTKRLHLGTYNTNGTRLITGTTFSSNADNGSIFGIYSWTINDSNNNVTYIGSNNFAPQGIRYLCPLDTDWNTIYAGTHFSNDIILVLNQATGIYQIQSTMPYTAARLFKDKDGRWAAQVIDTNVTPTTFSNARSANYVDILSTTIGTTLQITAANSQYTYTGNTINSNVQVNVYDYLGNRVSSNVTLNIIGPTSTPGIRFDNGTYTKTITTSNSQSTSANIEIFSSAPAKIVGNVVY